MCYRIVRRLKMQQYKYSCKISAIGAEGVGKTTFLNSVSVPESLHSKRKTLIHI
jgi:hypothetical protein